MILYRLSQRIYCNDISGRGAELFGGRWNSKGLSLLYTAESRALAAIEIAVHTPLGIIPKNYYLTTIEAPDNNAIAQVDISTLPENWNKKPFTKATQKTGDDFIKAGKYLILQVPSATVKGDYNYLINPHHPDFKLVKIKSTEPFDFDERLFKK